MSRKSLLICLKIGLFFSVITSCVSPKTIRFPEPVDTNTKPIALQNKQVFPIPGLGVFLSNDFDGARLNGVEKINDTLIALDILPENLPINDSPYYAFKAWAGGDKNVYFKFRYPNGFKHRYIPKIKHSEKDWVVADSVDLIFKDSILHLRTRLSKDTVLISAQEITSSQNVEDWAEILVDKNPATVRLKSAGQSVMGKNIPMFDIYSDSAQGKDIIVLLTRQHPPEVTGYMAFQNFLETIVDGSPLSTSFLAKYRVLAFPIMNPDGADLGHWRHNAGGVDLNRDWSRYRQPETEQVARRIEETLKESDAQVILGLDFHSTWYDIFYTNEQREKTEFPNFEKQWFAGLEANIPDYQVNEKSSTSTKPVSKGWFLKRFGAVGITYEIGDETPREFIRQKGEVSAREMMTILNSYD